MIYYEFPKMKYSEIKGLISIIVPIYNNETYLKECLESILAQTLTNWEAILVNDGSTDNTKNIVDEYVVKDSRFIAIHKQNEGTLLARKTGLENSKGEFIANIDHDDTYHPQFLEKMYAKIKETNVNFVWCKCGTTDKSSPLYVTDYKWDPDTSKNVSAILTLSQGMSFLTWNKLVKREIYSKVYFPNMNIIWGEDPIQMIQVAYHSKSAVFVPEDLYVHKLIGYSSIERPIPSIQLAIVLNETLKILFNNSIPKNVKNAFFRLQSYIPFHYFLLDKKTKMKFKDEVQQIMLELVKLEPKLNLKIVLLLASIGMEFPFKFRELLKRIKRKFNGRKE